MRPEVWVVDHVLGKRAGQSQMTLFKQPQIDKCLDEGQIVIEPTVILRRLFFVADPGLPIGSVFVPRSQIAPELLALLLDKGSARSAAVSASNGAPAAPFGLSRSLTNCAMYAHSPLSSSR